MLTDTQIKKAIATATAETTLNDGADGRGTGSLRLRIRPSARGTTATWLAWWKVAGKRQSKPLGKYPAIGLAAARAKFAAEITPALSAGKNPRVIVVAAEKPTIERMFQGYVASMKADGKESAGEVERVLLTCGHSAADIIGRHRMAADIDSADVVAYVEKIYLRGSRSAADKARSYVTSAFNWAKRAANDYRAEVRQDWGIKYNPAADIMRDGDACRPRERNLSADELAALWNGTAGAGFTMESRNCIRLLIATGQRVRETLRVHGEEIDLVAALWKMPAHKTKTKARPHDIPLPPQAVEAFRELIAAHGSGALFPARKGAKGEYIHDASIMQAIDRWTEATKAAPFITKDIRRTWKSRSHDAGIDPFTRDLIQQHEQGGTSKKHYDRAEYLPQKREAMDKWGRWLADVIGGKSRK